MQTPKIVLLPAFLAFSAAAANVHAAPRFSQGDPTDGEQFMLELINRARANPAAEAARIGISLNEGLLLGGISKSAKPPLAFNAALIQAARAHSRWMLSTGNFSHTGSGGSDAGSRMEKAGYDFSGSWTRSENIGYGSTGGKADPASEILARHSSLFQSPQHRKNICQAGSLEVGLGIASGAFGKDKGNAVVVTQDFAANGHSVPMVTGVVFQDRDGDGFYGLGEGVAGVTVRPEGVNAEAVTSSSGGYAVPCTAGEESGGSKGPLTITFSGGPFSKPRQMTITRTGENVKADVVLPRR